MEVIPNDKFQTRLAQSVSFLPYQDALQAPMQQLRPIDQVTPLLSHVHWLSFSYPWPMIISIFIIGLTPSDIDLTVADWSHLAEAGHLH